MSNTQPPWPLVGGLYTFVKNMRATTTFYGYLPPHGKNLFPGEEIGFAGDLSTRISGRPGRFRDFSKYEQHLAQGDIVLISTPGVILQDITTTNNRQLSLNNGTLGTLAPSWETASATGHLTK